MGTQKTKTKKINVLLVSIVNRNLGDTVIADTTEYMIKNAFLPFSNMDFQIFRYNIYKEDYELLSLADLIVFAGGGIIKYKQENFYEHTAHILNVAEEYKIPVFLNCVGVEGFDEEDERCQILKQALNLSCVKGISVRDDVDTLRQHYIEKRDIRVSKVIDPAILCSKVYQKEQEQNTKTIGLGIIRDAIFTDYGIEGIDKEMQISLWCGIIKEIEAMGYTWQIFTNGLRADEIFAKEVLEASGKAADENVYLAERPVTSKDLVSIISGYAGIIAGRMHSNIIAYALQIPSIALVWNEKLRFWGERIGYQDRFITAEQMQVPYIMEQLKESLKNGVKQKFNTKVCQLRMKYELAYFLNRYGNAIEEKKKVKNAWNKRLVAAALGGAELQYGSLNHIPTMKEKYKDGFRKFEADIRLTSDGKLVCVNGWSEKTYERLGLNYELYATEPPSYGEFMKCKSYGIYETADFEQLISSFEEMEGCTLILDIGRPKKNVSKIMLQEMNGILKGRGELLKRIIVRLQLERDVLAFAKSNVKYRLAYYIPPKEVWEEKKVVFEDVINLCQENKVKWITFSKEAFSEELIEKIHDANIHVCVFSFNTYTEMKDALLAGADLVATYHVSIKMLRELVKEKII